MTVELPESSTLLLINQAETAANMVCRSRNTAGRRQMTHSVLSLWVRCYYNLQFLQRDLDILLIFPFRDGNLQVSEVISLSESASNWWKNPLFESSSFPTQTLSKPHEAILLNSCSGDE